MKGRRSGQWFASRGRRLVAGLAEGFAILGTPFAILVTLLGAASPVSAREAPGVVIPEGERGALGVAIRAAMARYDSVSTFPLPALDDERLEQLLDGEVVRFREKWELASEGEEARERHRVLAFRLVRAPRLHVWLSALDPHFVLNDRIREVVVRSKTDGSSTWYQYMDLPWPLRNRHWVIDLAKGVDVCRATQGQAWEQTWHLVPDGEAVARQLAADGRTGPIPPDKVRGARYLEANDGAWAVFALGDDLTLVTYNLTIVLGGLIPEGMAARFAMRALEDLLDRVAANVAKLPAHYVEGHEPIYAGDATPIPPAALSAAAKPAEPPPADATSAEAMPAEPRPAEASPADAPADSTIVETSAEAK